MSESPHNLDAGGVLEAKSPRCLYNSLALLDYHNDKLDTHVLGRLQMLRPLVWECAGGSGVVVGVFNNITLINDEKRILCFSGVEHVVLDDS